MSNLEGYAGGFLAARFLVGVYLLVFARGARPLQTPAWWAAGLATVIPIGPQIVNGLLEGIISPGEDYTVRYGSVLPPLVVMAGVAVVFAYLWRWRAVWPGP